MSVLRNETKNQILISDLQIASSFLQRGFGLIPRKSLSASEGLLIHNCQTIHTCFMSFSIDCIFVNKKMQVEAIVENVKPWRATKFFWRAKSVIELSAGSASRLKINLGDQLHVGN